MNCALDFRVCFAEVLTDLLEYQGRPIQLTPNETRLL